MKSKKIKRSRKNQTRKKSPLILLLLILLWSIVIGWGIAIGGETPANQIASTNQPIADSNNNLEKFNYSLSPTGNKSVDFVPPNQELGLKVYLENCASCHIPVPPAVLPSESWRRILLEPQQHYGQRIQLPIALEIQLMWNYLSYFSRPLQEEEPVPYRIERSRYFQALHPQVDLPATLNLKNCATCHPNATQFDYSWQFSEQ
ncbi:MAG: diheme cytochrome C [Oscillatoria sp. PMC 1051.18]|nr:diheme cytochrome C [Oscillatoria sp. PMC 1050.18]MEC5031204.1 diheme cytochrome C [Oscillatoria sp. PMC 1051.18]